VPTNHADAVVDVLLDRCGETFGRQAGIRLADTPAPLYQLLVLATLLSARISADIAVAAARELFAAGYRTPRAMRDASWQDRVDALGRGHYRRYDERTATMLGDGAALLLDRWHGDLRALRDEALAAGPQRSGGPSPQAAAARAAALLTAFPGIGPAGASIFLREVQAVWPQVFPYADDRVREGARAVGLPAAEAALASLAGSGPRLARLAAALVRVSRRRQAAAEVTAAAGT
jgi:endonuclease III